MDEHQHDPQPPSGRRKFLRQLGTTVVATAALSGLADLVGLRPAAAATRAEGDMQVRDTRHYCTGGTLLNGGRDATVVFSGYYCIGGSGDFNLD